MDREGRMEMKNKTKPLGTKIYENIDTMYVNKILFSSKMIYKSQFI